MLSASVSFPLVWPNTPPPTKVTGGKWDHIWAHKAGKAWGQGPEAAWSPCSVLRAEWAGCRVPAVKPSVLSPVTHITDEIWSHTGVSPSDRGRKWFSKKSRLPVASEALTSPLFLLKLRGTLPCQVGGLGWFPQSNFLFNLYFFSHNY